MVQVVRCAHDAPNQIRFVVDEVSDGLSLVDWEASDADRWTFAAQPTDGGHHPTRRLVAAVLMQALDDLKLGAGVRDRSLRWVCNSRAEEPWSFNWCCGVLRLDPGATRRRLMQA